MVLLLDASAYLKLYVVEPGTGVVKRLVREATAIYAPQSAYVEVRISLALGVKAGLIREKIFAAIQADFERDWGNTHVVVPDQPMLRDAAVMAERYLIDNVRAQVIAAGARLSRELATDSLLFCTADAAVQDVAISEGIHTELASVTRKINKTHETRAKREKE